MFEAAELDRSVPKKEYEAEVPALRRRLLDAQAAVKAAGVPVLVVVSGADGAGKGETVKRLHEWLDPRGVETHAFGAPSDEERERPRYWRFWRTLPERGRVGVFFGSWYTDPILQRVYKKTKNGALDQALAEIAAFERLLVDDGALVVKFWLHLSKKQQRKRLEQLASDKRTRWRVRPLDWKHLGLYDRFRRVSERAIRATDASHAPWFLVEATDDRYRELAVGRTLAEQMEARLASPPAKRAVSLPAEPASPVTGAASITILDHVELGQKLEDKDYDRRLARLQGRLGGLARKAFDKGRSTVAVFEGWDASGKGGSIRRVTAAMDARLYRVISIAAPTDEERAHHYLWRFWRQLPRAGRVTLYDRSWYGRVLVERVEGFTQEEDWRRAYLEINEFERQLVDHGSVLLKFWIHIDGEEQLRRFREREEVAHKRHKITEEDWRNRERWDAYEQAVNEMVARTSTAEAPWTIVPGNDKRFARVHILETFCRRLAKAL